MKSSFQSDSTNVAPNKESKHDSKSSESKGKIAEIDADIEKNVVDLLCNTLLNLPVSTEDIKDALHKVSHLLTENSLEDALHKVRCLLIENSLEMFI